MNIPCDEIADALRAEIIEYGGLLNCFDEQQRLLLAHDAAGVLRLSQEIERMVPGLQACRARRVNCVTAFARSQGRDSGSTLRSLLPCCDAEVRPLLEALINEVNVLIHRLRRCQRHNQVLLTATVNSRRDILSALRPEALVQTYSAAGFLSASAPSAALKASG